jgi:hypothetical protein
VQNGRASHGYLVQSIGFEFELGAAEMQKDNIKINTEFKLNILTMVINKLIKKTMYNCT